MTSIIRTLPFAAGLLPALVLAQGELGEVTSFFENIVSFINNTLVPLIFAIAFLVFIWGVFKYFILGGGDEGAREEGRKYMLYGIVGFVIMVSVWGIVNLLANGLGFTDENIQNIPDVELRND